MADPFIGQIVMFGGNFAPTEWAHCDGQLVSIATNTALFSLLGTIYGGDGETTFALPDLRGRVPVHRGNGPGLTPVSLGERGGNNNHILTVGEMPSHNHVLRCVDDDGGLAGPKGNNLANASSGTPFSGDTADSSMHSTAVQNNGGNQQFSLMQPYLGVNFIIALVGVFPSQN